jgi:TRAP-type C4-dicarboxylate transport system permease small subunit
MRAFLEKLAIALNRLTVVALWLSGACLVGMTLVVAYQVFGRYVLNATPSWAEAMSITLMGWFVFLGAAVGVRERTHLGFDVLLYIMPPSAKVVLRMLADIAVFAFGMGMVFYGTQLAVGTWTATRPTLGIPDGVSYFPVVVGGFLVCLFTLTRMVERLAGMRPDDIEAEITATGS